MGIPYFLVDINVHESTVIVEMELTFVDLDVEQHWVKSPKANVSYAFFKRLFVA